MSGPLPHFDLDMVWTLLIGGARWVCGQASHAHKALTQHVELEPVSAHSNTSLAVIAMSPVQSLLVVIARVAALCRVFLSWEATICQGHDASSMFQTILLVPHLVVISEVAEFHRLRMRSLLKKREIMIPIAGPIHLPLVILRLAGIHDLPVITLDLCHRVGPQQCGIPFHVPWRTYVNPFATAATIFLNLRCAALTRQFIQEFRPAYQISRVVSQSLSGTEEKIGHEKHEAASAPGDNSFVLRTRSPVNASRQFAMRLVSVVWLCLLLTATDCHVQHAAALFRAVVLAPQVYEISQAAELQPVRSLLDKFQILNHATSIVHLPAVTLRFLGIHAQPFELLDPRQCLNVLTAKTISHLVFFFAHFQSTKCLVACIVDLLGAHPCASTLQVPFEASAGPCPTNCHTRHLSFLQIPSAAPHDAQLEQLRQKLSKSAELLEVERAVNRQLRADLLASKEKLKHALLNTEQARNDAEALEVKLALIFEDLCQICTCPLTMQPMDEPVVAPDLRSYELTAIRKWIEENHTSPFTRLPMCEAMLRVNKTVQEVKDTLCKHWPSTEAISRAAETLPQLVGSELVDVMADEEESAALELLARPIEDFALNNLYKLEGVNYSLLQLAIVYHLPRAACAIASRRDFRRALFSGTTGFTAMHMAALMGYEELCQIILKDEGRCILAKKTFADATMILESGATAFIPAGATPLSIARNAGHQRLANDLEGGHRLR